MFVFIQKTFVCTLEHKKKNQLLDAVVDMENSFRHEETQINDILLEQAFEYKSPMSFEMNGSYNVFAFNLEPCNVDYSEYCESYGTGVYHLNNLYWCFIGSLNKEEHAIERSKNHVFDRENGNPVLNLMDYVINIYNGKPNCVFRKLGSRILSSYKNQLIGHNASGFDNTQL